MGVERSATSVYLDCVWTLRAKRRHQMACDRLAEIKGFCNYPDCDELIHVDHARWLLAEIERLQAEAEEFMPHHARGYKDGQRAAFEEAAKIASEFGFMCCRDTKLAIAKAIRAKAKEASDG